VVDYVWQHTDPRGMSAAITAALDPAEVPETQDAKIAELRALLVASMYMLDVFSTVGPHPLAPDPVTSAIGATVLGERTTAQFANPERLGVGRALMETWRILAIADAQSNDLGAIASSIVAPQFATLGGAAPLPVPVVKEAGFAWPVAAVWVVGIAATAVCVLYIADKSGNVIDNELTRIEATRQMVLTQSQTLGVLAKHKAAEDAAGAELPLTEGEKAAIGALAASQIAAQKAIKLKLPSLFPDLKDKGGDIIDAAKSLGWGALAIAGLLAYVFLQKGK
jgi:hypothetical protein